MFKKGNYTKQKDFVNHGNFCDKVNLIDNGAYQGSS